MFNVLDARVFSALDCTFKSPLDPPDPASVVGLSTGLSRISQLTIKNCKFEGANVKWDSKGQPRVFDSRGKVVPRFTGDKQPLRYLTDWGVVLINNTPLVGVDWADSEIKSLTIEDSSFTENSLAHCEIGDLAMSNVTIGGKLDFSDTRVAHFRSDRLTKKDLNLVKDKLTKFELTAAGAEFASPVPGKRFS